MLGVVYTSLSGMQAYRTALDTISNNVANMNTPGFKLSDPLFRDLVQQHGVALNNNSRGNASRGAGVQAEESRVIFQQGDLRDTGNSLDAAIEGTGLFVLEQNGRQIYSRAGQFQFDRDGFLVDRDVGARVLVSTATHSLGHFDLNPYRTFAPRATSEVLFTNTLARTGAATFTVSGLKIYDTSGAELTLSARFVRDSADPLHWTLEVLNESNTVLGSGGVRFNADGTPATGANSVTVDITPTNSTAVFAVEFSIGAPDTHSGVTSVSTPAGTTATSNVEMLRQNGIRLGSITKIEFDDVGQIKITYSNGEELRPATLRMARFESPEQLTLLGGSRYAFVGDRQPILGTALSDGMGRIVGGKVEMSNVDLTNQMTDLIIVQRGFQGSSQIASVANEMMQQLLAMNGGK